MHLSYYLCTGEDPLAVTAPQKYSRIPMAVNVLSLLILSILQIKIATYKRKVFPTTRPDNQKKNDLWEMLYLCIIILFIVIIYAFVTSLPRMNPLKIDEFPNFVIIYIYYANLLPLFVCVSYLIYLHRNYSDVIKAVKKIPFFRSESRISDLESSRKTKSVAQIPISYINCE